MKRLFRKALSLMLAIAMVVTVCPQTQIINVSADSNEPYCISEGRPTYSSSDNGGDTSDKAVDGSMNTRWQAANSDKNEWFYVDLGKKADIDHIYIKWENAYAKSYEIQFSDDETEWRTVYTKGKGASSGEGETESQAMSLSRSSYSTNGEKNVTTLSWSSIGGVSYYYIYLDDITDKTPATAADGYPFNGNWGTRTSCEVWVRDGEHTYTVVAYDANGKELASASMVMNSEDIEETTTPAPGQTVDPTEQTITFDNLGASEKQARYVKIVCTERQLEAYGCSMFEFQVYGDNGLVERPADYGTNLALNQPVTCSGIRDEWWMYDSEGNLNPDAVNNVKAENAVDGNKNTSFTSYQGDDQWIYVDLGQPYTLGRVVIDWNADAGKIYDVDVSADGKSWTTVHRVLKGYTEMEDNFTFYKENVRYVRVFGYTKVESGSGFGINELQVYEYVEDDSKENETIEALPQRQIVNNPNGKGSYVTNEMYNEKNKLPSFINEENISVPIDSNSWWSSILVKKFSNLLCVHPLKAQYSTKGLSVLTATSGWVGTRGENDLGTNQESETGVDFYIMPDGYNSSKGYDRVENYGDYSVEVGLMDNHGLQMSTTLVKGSPYLFTEFPSTQTIFINSSTITEIFDGDGNTILTEAGKEVVTDHFGFSSLDAENDKSFTDKDDNGNYYSVNLPVGTTVKAMVVGSKDTLKITFPTTKDNYMSVGTMTSKDQIDDFYEHGYAFVTDTYVGYTFDEATSKVVTTYEVTTELKRSGLSEVTMQTMYPHQWKMTTADNSAYTTYTSIRGDMKGIWANSYTTTQQFSGLLPTFALPDSDMFDSAEMIEYLNAVVAAKINTAPVDDAYWEGKNVHPLAISAIMADQLGETEIKDKLLKKLKSIFVDWFNYDGGDDKCYLIYNKDWGTVYYPNSAYGANAAICDHNFTYGYFAYGAAVLAMYDKEFLEDYGDMVEILIRDYANPLEGEEDGMFCKFRSFDQYSGHAWAGGYGDNDSGNNQESASEALFAWVGMYLWGQVTQNQTYIDASAYGFTTEMYAVLQYWFDYDETNWLEEFPFEGVGQIYGATMGYGTYFGGQPTYVYGIQWLPISEYLTNYGMNQEKAAKVYAGLEYDTQYAIDIEMRLGNITDPDQYVTPDNGWQHITWPFLSQTDPQRAYDKFSANVTRVQTEDRANTLWFISAMDQLGYRTTDYVVTGDIQGSVYYNDETKQYTAEVWNPTDTTQTVTIKDQLGKVAGTANVGSRGLVSFNIDTDKSFNLSQVATPVMKATALADGTVKENLSGEAKFNDTQIVELSCSESGATVYYTTDGTTPTTESDVYSGRILVSSNTTVKAIAIKDGYINSAYAATAFIIEGDTIQSGDNLALGRTATASSEDGGKVAANAIDGDSGNMWQGDASDDEWLQVDLGSVQAVNTVTIDWEAAYAAKYQIQVSTDGEKWTTVDEVNGVVGEVTSTFAATKARYVRMQGISRGTQYGYGIHEIEIYGAVQAQAPTITPASGIYDVSQTVIMSTAVKGAEIKYTTDGSTPTEDSATYITPITVDKSATVKAITYRKGMIVSDVTESTIIIAGTISLNKAASKIAIGRTVQLVAMTDETVTWSSSNTAAATVDQNGLVTGKAVGTTVITAETASGARATCEVTVTEPIHIQAIAIKPATLEMKNKTSETLSVIITPADTTDDTTVTWTSSDESVLVVNENGTITGKAEGTATITAKVGNFTATCAVTVGPAATTEEMILSSKYNAALKKKATANPSKQEGDEKNVTDGSITGGHAATKFGTAGTYYEIDLGATYDASGIDQIISVYKEESDADTPVKGYEIQYSTNGIDFTTVKVVDGQTAKAAWIANELVDVQDVSGNTGAVRYVRLYYPDSYNYGIQVREIAVLSTEQNLKTVEVETCANPADLSLSSDAYCEITYTITPDEGQEEYKYIVYLDGVKVADRVNAGTYTLTDVKAGTHTVQVISYYNKLTSAGISRTVEVDDGSLVKYVGTDRNLAIGATVTVDTIEVEHEEGSKKPATLVDGVISKDTVNVVETTWGTKTATILMDLGKEVSKNSISEVLIAFKANNTNATDYTIEFSADGENYETVITAVDAEYDEEANEHIFDPAAYTQDTVQYVRINITDGNANWGYQISEIAVMGGEEFMPIEPEGLVATSTSYNTITVTWTGADNGQTYFVYIDDAIKDMNLIAAGTYTYAGIDGGTHTVKVTSKLNGIESEGVTTTVEVEEAPTTTPAPTTPKQTTTPSPTTTPEPTTTTPVGIDPATTTEPGAIDPVTTTIVTDPTTGGDSDVTTTQGSGEKVTTTTVGSSDVKAPGKTKVKKAKKKAAKKVKLSLKKIKGAKGYQVAVYKTKKKAKKNKKAIVKKFVKKVKFTLKSKKLKNKKKLFVRARAYVLDASGGKIYGKWSKVKKVKIKK